jgi:hypothetical protein
MSSKRDRLKKYGLTLEDYYALGDRQGWVCEICREDIEKDGGETLTRACVDHCHATGKVRALLCHRCNIGIGCFREDIDLFKQAIRYVRRHNWDQEYVPLNG